MKAGVTLANSSAIGSTAYAAQSWSGGRSMLVIDATQLGPGVIFQLQTPIGNWIPVCSTIVTSQIYPFDGPAGSYRIISNAGSTLNIGAVLLPLPYGG